MDIFKQSYKQYLPQYKQWKESQDALEQKRLEYLRQHPEKIDKDDIQRGEALLSAINTLDDYSQNRAEDVEVATTAGVEQALAWVSLAGLGIGFLLSKVPAINNKLGNYLKDIRFGDSVFSGMGLKKISPANIMGAVAGSILSSIACIPLAAYAAKLEVGASRRGRFEAMKTDLSNPNHFAVLTPEQIKQLENESQNTVLTPEEKKKKKDGYSIFDPIKTLFKIAKENEQYKIDKEEFERKLDNHSNKFDVELNSKDIENAKRDQQLITKIIHKIDVASQDYAEKAELATSSAVYAGYATGGILALLAKGGAKLFKAKSENVFLQIILPMAAFVGIPIAAALLGTKIQKQASRVGRHNVIQEMRNNPESLVYLNDEELKNDKNIHTPKKEKDPNVFKFALKLFRENRAYNKYLKENGEQIAKRQKATEKITVDKKQTKDAQTLQENTFKAFNKIDDMSQEYSERVEAKGEVIKRVTKETGAVASMLLGVATVKNLLSVDLDAPDLLKNNKVRLGLGLGVLSLILKTVPPAIIDMVVTKEQKKASRVANMLGIQELQDYRHFVDYENLSDAPSSAPRNEVLKNLFKDSPFKDFKFI